MIRLQISSMLLVTLAMIILTTMVNAEVPNYINYQGRLTDDNGQPITGPKLMKFKIYGSQSGNDSLWSSAFRTVQIDDGLFSVKLGGVVPLPADLFPGNEPRYLGITVDTDTELTPRTEFITVPYSFHAVKADTSDWAVGGPGAESWYDEGDVIHLTTSTDRVGIGPATAGEPLVVGKDLGSFGGSYIVSGSPYLDDICGFKLGYSANEHATLEWNGDGNPFAIHTRQGGVDYNNTLVVNSGKVGIGLTPSAFRMEVKSSGSSDGFRVTSSDGSQLFRIRESSAGSCEAYVSDNAGNTGVLIRGEGNSYFNAGDVAIGTTSPADNTALTIDGTYDISDPEFGYGIKSNVTINGNTNGWAGHFTSNRGGIYASGENAGGYFDGESIGIYASGNPAGYFQGDVLVYGNLSKTSGSFKIDHPLDPENKYLQHSFVESPDMMNIYNGNVILDNNGEAVVEMPDWFEPLNKDCRYQLTCIGGFEPVYISEKMNNGKFSIAGGKPGLEVSWQVTGVRQDRWANQHRIEVEIDKPEEDKGYYIAPELYGFGKEKSIDYKLRVMSGGGSE